MRVRFLVYQGFYASAPRDIKDALARDYPGIKRLWLDHPEMTFMPRPEDVVINWGCIKPHETWGGRQFHWLNNPSLVARNRLTNLRTMRDGGVNVPEFTIVTAEAQKWYDDGRTVVCRDTLRSFGGRGITIREPRDNAGPIARAALYTRYQPKKREYRVHVFRGNIIDVQQKMRRQGDKSEGLESKVRSYGNGWVFGREGVVAPDCIRTSSLAAVQALGLDFAAVDVGWTEQGNLATVYECNTAPGLEGSSIGFYADAIRRHISELR